MTRPAHITPLTAGFLGAGAAFLLAVLAAFTLPYLLSFPVMKWLYSVGIGGWLFGAEGAVWSFPSALLGVVVGLFAVLALLSFVAAAFVYFRHVNAGSTPRWQRRMSPHALPPPIAGFLGAGAAFSLAGALAWQAATAPVGLISALLSLGVPLSGVTLAGALPDDLTMVFSRLLFLLALPSLAAAGLCAFLTRSPKSA